MFLNNDSLPDMILRKQHLYDFSSDEAEAQAYVSLQNEEAKINWEKTEGCVFLNSIQNANSKNPTCLGYLAVPSMDLAKKTDGKVSWVSGTSILRDFTKP